jgi:hypothetical protein
VTRSFRTFAAVLCALILLSSNAAFGSDDKPAGGSSGSGSSGSGSSGSGSSGSGSGSSGSGSSGSGSDSRGRGRGGDNDDDTSSVPEAPTPTAATVPHSTLAPPGTSPTPLPVGGTTPLPVGATTQPASGGSRERRTRCGARGWATLRVQDKGSSLRVRFSIDPRPSSTWSVVVLHERRIAWRGTVRRGEFDRLVQDYPGADAIAVRADDGRGTVCTVELVTPG